MNFTIILFALLTFFSTLIGGLIAIRFRNYLPFFFAFAAGSLIGVTFFDLLPESLEIAREIGVPVRSIMLAIVVSFLFYSILEKYFLTHHHHEGEEGHPHKLGEIGAGSLILHSFVDGLAIGAAFQINSAVGLIVALAVIFHDFTDGINTVTLMLKHKHNVNRAATFLLFDALAPVIGVLLISLISVPQKFLVFILAVFAGEFLYIGAATLLPETHKHDSKKIILFMLLGAFLIYLLTSFI